MLDLYSWGGLVGYDAALTRLRSRVQFPFLVFFLFSFFLLPLTKQLCKVKYIYIYIYIYTYLATATLKYHYMLFCQKKTIFVSHGIIIDDVSIVNYAIGRLHSLILTILVFQLHLDYIKSQECGKCMGKEVGMLVG